jgi:hypothetical protein
MIHRWFASLTLCCVLSIAAYASALSAQDEPFTQAELDAMLAPVALYPDSLLLQVLVAATHPVDVVRAARWLREQEDAPTEQQIVQAGQQNRWDASVMALLAFPEVLDRLDQSLDWTQDLGSAFMVQESQVLDTVQGLREQAMASGHLTTTEHIQVVREVDAIAIRPVRREVIFVPVYDTRVVYGHWYWAHHPPVFWSPPPRHYGGFGGVYWSSYYRPYSWWHGQVLWPQRTVVINTHHHYYPTAHRARTWQHRPSHRYSHQTAPRQTAPRQAAPRQAAPRQTAPRQAAPRQAAPRQAAPRQAAPRQAAPRQAAPREAVSRASRQEPVIREH